MPRRIRSALFIDFENMPLANDKIDSWLAWLEDGGFDKGRKRQLVIKRVYWNSSAKKHEARYRAGGFEVVCCERYHGLVNSVDVQMAIDIVESTRLRIKIDEYILITRDSDFVPVLRRLREKNKRTAFLVDESKPNIHTTYGHHADVLIPVRELNAARNYTREIRTPRATGRASHALSQLQLFADLEVTPPAMPARSPAPAADAPPAPAAAKPLKARKAGSKRRKPAGQLAKAAAVVVRVMARNKGRQTARSKIIKALRGIAGFSTSGAEPFLGHRSYKDLMLAVAALEDRIEVVEQNDGGIVVRAAPGSIMPGPREGSEAEGAPAPPH